MLKYLFEALLFDGTSIRQTADDNPKLNSGKSAWSDVIARLDEVEALLLHRSGHEVVASVWMSDGRFRVNGNEFFVAPCGVTNPHLSGGQYRAHYYTRPTFSLSSGEELDRLYAIGWEYVVDGKVVATQVIMIR